VTVTARAAAAFTELDDADNAATTSLAPDVVLESVQVTGHRDVNRQALVRVEVAGVPAGVGTVRVRLSGAPVGTGSGQVHLTDGASGANGEGDVSCHTSDADGAAVTNGVYATCTGVRSAAGGRFYLDLRLAHPHGTDGRVTFTVLPVGVDQGTHGGNDALDATIR
jgi:hypothetical protein